jgi:nitroreductase
MSQHTDKNPVIDLLEKRVAGRSINKEQLPSSMVDELIEAARLTPSCFNNQPWRFLFLQSEEARKKGYEVLAPGNQIWAGRAPLLVIAYAQRGNDCVINDGRAYYQFDMGMAVMSLMLAATVHGLTARPMAGFSPVKAKELFGLAPEDEPLVMLAIGRPSNDESFLPDHYKGLNQKPRERKSASEVVKNI